MAGGRVRDAELRAVLVVARHVVDDLQPVVRDVGLERGGGRPGVAAAVGDGLDDAEDGNVVLGGAAAEDEGDGAGACGLPGYGEGDAGGDGLVEAGWRGDVVSSGGFEGSGGEVWWDGVGCVVLVERCIVDGLKSRLTGVNWVPDILARGSLSTCRYQAEGCGEHGCDGETHVRFNQLGFEVVLGY